jgi:hypothetical protein
LFGLHVAVLSSGTDEHPASSKAEPASVQAQTTDNLARSMRNNFLEKYQIDYIERA